MLLEGITSQEKFVTHRAGVFLFFCVNVDVFVPIVFAGETQRAMGALDAAKECINIFLILSN